jgi:hypothetical protein
MDTTRQEEPETETVLETASEKEKKTVKVKEENDREIEPATEEDIAYLYSSIQEFFATRPFSRAHIHTRLQYILDNHPKDHSLFIVILFFIEQLAFERYYRKYQQQFERFKLFSLFDRTVPNAQLSAVLGFRGTSTRPDFIDDIYQDLCVPPKNIHVYMEHMRTRMKSNAGLIVTDLTGNWAQFADAACANNIQQCRLRDFLHYEIFVKDTYKYHKICLYCYHLLCTIQLQDLYLSHQDRLSAFPFLQSKCNYAQEFYGPIDTTTTSKKQKRKRIEST